MRSKLLLVAAVLSIPLAPAAELPKPRYVLQKEVVKDRGPLCKLFIVDRIKNSRTYLGIYGDFDFDSDWVEVKGKYLVAGLGDRLSDKKLFLYDISRRKVVLGQTMNPKNFIETAAGEHKIFSNGVFGRVTTPEGEMWFVWDATNRLTVAKPPSNFKGAHKVTPTSNGLRFMGKSWNCEILSLPKIEKGTWTLSLTVRP